MKIALIEWLDSACHGDRVEYKGTEKELSPLTGVSVGVLVREDERSLTLAMDWFQETEHYRTLMTIPRCSVRSVEMLTARSRAAKLKKG